MAFLCISLNNSSVNVVHLLDGELSEIDKYTVNFDNPKDILKEYPEKIEELNHIYNVNDDSVVNIKVRIFLSNDKERFVMYKKHLIAFRMIIKNRRFLQYASNYESTLLDKKYWDMVLDEQVSNKQLFSSISEVVNSLDETAYYDFVRRICYQYNNYIEDYQEEQIPTIDMIYHNYLNHIKKEPTSTSSIPAPLPINSDTNNNVRNPFMVFEHPNFDKKYGRFMDINKPVFILGSNISEATRNEYSELYDNCEKCFKNPIYYPLNANVSLPLTPDFLEVYDNSIIVIVDGNGYDNVLEEKIERASKKGITVLILTNDQHLEQMYKEKFQNNDMVIIRDYQYGEYNSKKMFADIIVGLYINEYKKQAR